MELSKLVHTDPLVASLERGVPWEVVIVCLARQRDELRARVMELEAIAPRRYKGPKGETLIWRCPDNLIPETKL